MPETETKIESAEMFAANYPDLHKEIVTAAKAEGMAEGVDKGQKEVRESFAEFAEKFGDDPSLCIEQFKAGATIEQAIVAQNEKFKKEKAEKAEKTAKQSPAHQEFSDQQAKPEKKEGQDNEPATFDAAVEARIEADNRDASDVKKKADAVRFCVGKYPDLHGKLLETNRQKS